MVTTLVTLALGVLGFLDDYQKVAKKNSAGVSGRVKLIWQAGVGLAAGLFLYFNHETASYLFFSASETGAQKVSITSFSFPLLSFVIPLSFVAIPLFMAILMGTSNAVNLTDGLDGLATGVTITVALAYTLITYLSGTEEAARYLHIFHNRSLAELSIVMMALVGACFGFLWFNCHPAQVFMGDTGSLALGGMLAGLSITTSTELLMVVIGALFVAEAASVVIQVAVFRSSRRRVFRMAPFHHHFELAGWAETTVIIRFWLLAAIASAIGLALFYSEYLAALGG